VKPSEKTRSNKEAMMKAYMTFATPVTKEVDLPLPIPIVITPEEQPVEMPFWPTRIVMPIPMPVSVPEEI